MKRTRHTWKEKRVVTVTRRQVISSKGFTHEKKVRSWKRRRDRRSVS